jgi:signal peptidase I
MNSSDSTTPSVEQRYELPTAARPSRGKAIVRELVETILLFVVVLTISRIVLGNFMIEQRSAVPNFLPGDRILVDQVFYKYVGAGIQRGDLIVMRAPRISKDDLFKRIVGLPGELIEIKQNKVYINGKQLPEPYVRQPGAQTGDGISRQLGPDEYYVMGDNRSESGDSRRWGPIKPNEIVGKAWMQYWTTYDPWFVAPRGDDKHGPTIQFIPSVMYQ